MKRFCVLLITLAIAAPVLAEEPPPLVEAAHNGVVRHLNLSEEQVADWDELYQIHRDAEQPIKEMLVALQGEIDALFEAGDPDAAEVGALVIERREYGEDLLEVHLIYHEAFVALLDETQVRRLRLVKRADDIQLVIPAFKLFELIPRR